MRRLLTLVVMAAVLGSGLLSFGARAVADPVCSQTEGHLVDGRIEQDQEILALAREILNAAGPTASGPGSVAASIMNQINKDGGTGFIGGQHVHNHGAPSPPQVTWELLRSTSTAFELRNTGTATATDVGITANVELAWPIPPRRDIPAGSSVMFICEPSLSESDPVVTVTNSESGAHGRRLWQRPLPR